MPRGPVSVQLYSVRDAFAADPANGAARIYYLFGDIAGGSERTRMAT